MGIDEEEKRKRLRQREDERDAEEIAIKQVKKLGVSAQEANQISGGDKFLELILRAEPLIEQLNNLYNMYFTGVEKIPPIERRKQLDQLMLSLQMMPKMNAAALFKYNNIYSKFISYRDRWEKMMKNFEDGKIKRAIGINKNKPNG